jgi:predicted DNA-binding protein
MEINYAQNGIVCTTEEFKKTKSVSLPKDIDQEMHAIVENLSKTDRKMCVNYYITLAVEEYNKKHSKRM